MALTEPQIRRYARHILLPEVGGAGQERLLAAEVKVSGGAAMVELACAYLGAAGVTCDAHSGAGLELVLVGGTGGVAVRGDGDVATVRSAACEACRGVGEGAPTGATGAIAAALAASECLRIALGLGDVARAWRVAGARVEIEPPRPCSAHGGGA